MASVARRDWALAFPYMENVSTATESIEDFFARYTGYLIAGDIEARIMPSGSSDLAYPRWRHGLTRGASQSAKSRSLLVAIAAP